MTLCFTPSPVPPLSGTRTVAAVPDRRGCFVRRNRMNTPLRNLRPPLSLALSFGASPPEDQPEPFDPQPFDFAPGFQC